MHLANEAHEPKELVYSTYIFFLIIRHSSHRNNLLWRYDKTIRLGI